MSAFLGRLTVAAALAALTLLGCSGAEEVDRDAVRAWLSCERCENGEREAVAAIRSGAVTLLMEPLDTSSRGGRNLRRALEASARASYRALPPVPGPPMDSAAYLRFFVANALALAQSRAAASLGDLGATDEIQEALDEWEERGLRPEVRRELRSALVRATTGLTPPADSVVLVPRSQEMEVGDTVAFSYVVLDAAGSSVPGATVTWAVVGGPSVTSVNAAGRVAGIGLGVDTVLATHAASGKVGRAAIHVVVPTPLPSLTLLGGGMQTGVVGALVGAPLIVQARNGDGTLAVGAPVAWSVVSGGGALSGIDYVTRADGTARARWFLGGQVGDQRVQVTGPRNVPVQIRATALPYTGPLVATGVVVVNGAAASNVEVRASGGSATMTDASGGFSLPLAAPGTYDITARLSASFSLPDVSKQVTLTADAPLGVVHFEAASELGSIVGALFVDDDPRNNVFDLATESRLMLANVTIEVVSPAGGSFLTTTAANGEFAFTGLPAGVYTVRLDPVALTGLPNVTFGGISPTLVVSLAPGGVSTVAFAFDPS